MAKLKISDYSSTSAGANLNTDINSIDIDEGCAPSGINNAIRTLMAQVKDFQTGVSGDGLTLGGALSGTSATFSGALSGTSATFSGNVTASAISGASMTLSGDLTADKVLVDGGTALLPAYSRSSDTNTGMFFPASNTIAFSESGVEAMRIDSNGCVLINNTDASSSSLRIRGRGTSSSTYSIYLEDSAGNDTFYVRDDGRIFTGLQSLSPYNQTIATGANMVVATNGTLYRSTSSLKYKKDVQDSTHGLDDVMKLRAVTYKGIGDIDGDTVFGGLIAEEVHDAGLTEFVQYDDEGKPDAIHYGHMVSLAFKAIQELKTELDVVKLELNTLKGN